MSLHLSKFLGISHKEIVRKGIYDAFINEDSKLHIDALF